MTGQIVRHVRITVFAGTVEKRATTLRSGGRPAERTAVRLAHTRLQPEHLRNGAAMLKLSDIMTADVFTLRPDNTLREAVELFSGNHISGAPVLEDGMLVGVLSTIDVMDAVAGEQRIHTTAGTAWIDDEDDLRDAAVETASYFTMTEYDEPDLAELGGAADGTTDVLDELTVADAMTRSIAELDADVEIHQAALYMLERGIHRVLVVNEGRLEGLVSTTDFLRAIAERRL